MTKKWLLLGSVTFSISFGLILLVSRDVKRSALSGLIAIPATFASVSVLEQQRKRQLNDTLSSLQRKVEDLKRQETGFNEVLLLRQTQTEDLKQQKATLEQEVSEATSQKQQLETVLTKLQNRQQELERALALLESQSQQLETQVAELEAQKQPLEEKYQHFNLATEKINKASTDALSTSYPHQQDPEILTQITSFNSNNSNVMNPKYHKLLWEEQIFPYWTHRDRPVGQRFLGSIRIQRSASEALLKLVGQNLQQIDHITYNFLSNKFSEPQQNWLKVFTFAISEYAYYYSREGFWQGFCKRLDINHNQGIENTLRQIVKEGIDILGLVKAQGGYKYVSTLWLQSGIPEQNLGHFAQLVQEIADEYGWWELAHSSDIDISHELWEYCQVKHPQWGTLIHFLKASYSENEETEPISGNLVQGIAIVAQELERQELSAQALLDENQREKLLESYYLPQNFFLRDWNKLIQVLTPRTGSSGSRGLVIRRSKPLSLILDIADSWNKQLILPQQVLWKREWRDLRGTYCQIPEAQWESNIPTAGDLEVPELVIDVHKSAEKWSCQLLDHNHEFLQTWQYEGITTNFPCLVFEALTGEHLSLHLPNPKICGVEEIIYFTSKDVEIELAEGIEVIDSYIPSSIRGWRGQQIRLIIPDSSIILTLADSRQSQVINWQLKDNEQPILTGLKLQGRKSIYLEAPTFWYPPHEQSLTLNVLIENITERTIIARILETLASNKRWFGISLIQWITQTGIYEARFWFESQRWSYRFEIQAIYKISISEITQVNQPRISNQLGLLEANLPINYDSPEKFWSEVIKIEQLWTLEEIIFFLSNEEDKVPYQLQADTSGTLTLNLSVLHDLLPESNYYILEYQRLGLEPQRLLEMNLSPEMISWTWANQAIHLSGLSSCKLYSLFCWNLLVPNKKPEEIKLPLVEDNLATITVPLSLPTGIYHIQISSSQQLLKNLGIWCRSGQYDLPEQANDNDDLANYCYTILDSQESVQDFLIAVKKLQIDFDDFDNKQKFQDFFDGLKKSQCNLPEWLDVASLIEKLKNLLSPPKTWNLIEKDPKNTSKNNNKKPQPKSSFPVQQENWYLVNIYSKKRDVFLKQLKHYIEKNGIQDLIVEIRSPQAQVYQDIVLLRLNNFKAVSNHIQKIDYFSRLQSNPLSSKEVSRMLGAK